MTKLTKLMTKPDLFFKDMLKKRIPFEIKKEANNQKESEQVSKLKKKAKEPNVIFDSNVIEQHKITDNIRFSTEINHLIHIGELIKYSSYVDYWIGEFYCAKVNFALLVRDQKLYQWAISKYPQANIVYAKNASAVEEILNKLPHLRAVYYVSNTANLIHTLRYNNYKHIFLGHGNPEKTPSAHKFFRVYDEIWVDGQATIDRFKKASFNTDYMNFVIVGKPSLKYIINSAIKNRNKSYTVKQISYLPTWENLSEENNYSSSHLSPNLLFKMHERFNCKIFAKYHPLTGSRNKSLAIIEKEINDCLVDCKDMTHIFDRNESIGKVLINSDLILCDYFLGVEVCLSTLSPIFMYIPNDVVLNLSKNQIDITRYAYVFSNTEQLISLINKVIFQGDDYLSGTRYKILDYIYGINETINNEFCTQLQRVSTEMPTF
ncbi:CDP-glycerol glycerophosphotransferase family protein [Escherichia coli]|uniref:CDP-glycerol glycerophosphotransferase family protein n=1 Tax=Escherichia coli TaxID=562 RepID=UPI001F61EEA3|nr:CDP-glycerol glycerophosphotransferase family protein [Escherichia coli]MCI3594453.1 CDP-glycerol glycerophosphotransferase family protein [Escherichia coli]MCQ1642111.1 CDP-glycerol glycerophosphotransferase family protein [Escherichia coli]